MKILSLTIIALSMPFCFTTKVKSQDSLYLFVDTVNIPKNQRKININERGAFIYYEFLCIDMKHHNSHEGNITALYIKRRNFPKPPILNEKPNYNYINYKYFLNIVHKTGLYFNNNYHLFITEVLPEKKYKTSKVYLEFPVKTTVN